MSVFEELSFDEPLPLIILVKGGSTENWEALAQAAIPMLLRPENFSPEQRSQVAKNFRLALQGEFEGDEPEYEPGEYLEWGEESP